MPVLLGPLSFVALSKCEGECNASEIIQRLVPAYLQALEGLGEMNAVEVQVRLVVFFEKFCDKKERTARIYLCVFVCLFVLFVQTTAHQSGFWDGYKEKKKKIVTLENCHFSFLYFIFDFLLWRCSAACFILLYFPLSPHCVSACMFYVLHFGCIIFRHSPPLADFGRPSSSQEYNVVRIHEGILTYFY